MTNPERASDPQIATQLLSAFLKDKEVPINDTVRNNNLRAARRLLNAGAHGLELFSDAYTIDVRPLG